MTTAERLTAVAENVKKVYEAGVRDGFTPPESEYLTPEYIYKTTRPGDWLTMPTPGDDEMYFLLHIPADADGYFAGRFEGSSMTLDFGTVVNGEFVSIETATSTSGVRFKKTVDHTKYGNVTADGWKQCMVRAKGAIQSVYLNKDSTQERNIFVKDFVCGAYLHTLKFGDYDYPTRPVNSLCYTRFVGSGELYNLQFAFAYCRNLRMVSCEKRVTQNLNISYITSECTSLECISDNIFGDTSDSRDMTHAFRASGLKQVPTIRFPMHNCESMFQDCRRLAVYDGSRVNTANATAFTNMFYMCHSLTQVLNLDISSATAVGNILFQCGALERLTFAGATTPGGFTMSVIDKCLSHNALVEMINSLPVAKSAATISITLNPGTAELTDAEIAVATAKNWTVTR